MPTVDDRSKGGEQSRTRYDVRQREIVDAAARLFAAQGYHATSMRDLTEATGLQRGALYHYFDAKEDLLYLIHERFLGPLLETVREIADRDIPAESALVAVAHSIMETIRDYRDQVTVFLHEWKTIRDDPRWAEVKASRRELTGLVESILERGARDGSFVVDDVPLAALGFFGMLNYTYQWLDVPGRRSASDVAEYFIRIFLHGISARSSSG
jgi:AcrR family transcriptional regulator